MTQFSIIAWPYIELTRVHLTGPQGVVYIPHLIGLLHGALVSNAGLERVLRTAVVLLGGSFFLCNALHVWDDLVDAPINAKIARTRLRPIPRGDVSPTAAFIWAFAQALSAALFLVFLPKGVAIYSVPSIALWIFCPYAKRVTNYPQFALGLAVGWAVFVGSASLGVDRLATALSDLSPTPKDEVLALLSIFGANIL